MPATPASCRHCPVCLGPVPALLRVPASAPRIAAARRPLRCRASNDGSRNFLDQAFQWGAALVRSGLERQAATVQRLRGGSFSAQEPLPSSLPSLAEAPEQRSADRLHPLLADDSSEEAGADEDFNLLPRVLDPPGLGDSFADWEQVSAPLLAAGHRRR